MKPLGGEGGVAPGNTAGQGVAGRGGERVYLGCAYVGWEGRGGDSLRGRL